MAKTSYSFAKRQKELEKQKKKKEKMEKKEARKKGLLEEENGDAPAAEGGDISKEDSSE